MTMPSKVCSAFLLHMGSLVVCLAVSFCAGSARGVGNGNDLIADLPAGVDEVKLEVFVDLSPNRVIDITNARDGSGRIFIVSPDGVIRIYESGSVLGTPFLTAPAFPSDRAMSSLAFHPNYASNGLVYVITGEAVPNASTPDYTAPQTDDVTAFDNVLFEYQVQSGNPNLLDTSTKRELLRVHQPHEIHDMNQIAFGGDGFLYIAMGDGGDTRTGTPSQYESNAQDTTTQFGAILRIDVNSTAHNGRYGIPAGNPFAGSGTDAPEIFAWGLRNAWRMSADRQTGLIYTAVNGDLTIEQIFRIEVNKNYGWAVKEGNYLWNSTTGEATVDGSPDPQYTGPLAEYDHNWTTKGFGSCIGGFVYRGRALPAFVGKYLFLDFVAAEIIAMNISSGALEVVPLDGAGVSLTVFDYITWGEDEDGELYIGKDDGLILKAVPASSTPPTVLDVAVQSGSTVDVTFNKPMGVGVTTPTSYALSGTGQGTLGGEPDSVALQSGNTYRLTWASGEMFDGGDVTVTVIAVQDVDTNVIASINSDTDLAGAIGTPPTVQSIVASSTKAGPATFDVTFNEPVSGVDETDFAVTVTSGSLTGESVQSVTGSGATRQVTIETGTGSGVVRLDLVDDDSIQDGAGNPLGGPGAGSGDYVSGETINVSVALSIGWLGVGAALVLAFSLALVRRRRVLNGC